MKKEETQINILTCENKSVLEGIRYGFFTRQGGVSPAPYDSLNVGLGSGDDIDNVIENCRRAMHAFAQKNEHALSTLYQVHGNHVIHVKEKFGQNELPKGDAMVTKTPGVVLGVLTADCGPVLFADECTKVIGAAHAGWKGAASGVLENTIAMMEKIGAKRNNIQAFVGPCIQQESYEVGKEFYVEFINLKQRNKIFFQPSPFHKERFLFDLPGFIKNILKLAGVGTVSSLSLDTCLEERHFFSYRRNTLSNIKHYGRGLSAIMID